MKRAAAYCRVSTDSSDQANSLASQEKYFRDYITRNPQWELCQVFVDTGITGTSTKKRVSFNKMMEEAVEGRFDLILTKEISRFARNTLDSIYYTRMLKEHGVGVIFMNDNINTLDGDGELRLAIMSSIAQEESRKISERVKWGQKRRMEQGIVFGRDLLGYDVRKGQLYVNEEGAETVRLIFHKFVNEGKGAHTIAMELKEAGIKTSPYMKQWSATAVLRILRNEKAVGDLIQKKTITASYLTHEKVYNKGQEDLVIITNHHQPIISRDLFIKAQEELKRRSPAAEGNYKYSCRHCFSGKIKCCECERTYVSRTKKRKDGTIYKAWRCSQAAAYGRKNTGRNKDMGCSCPSVNEEDLKFIMMDIIKSLQVNKNQLAAEIKAAVAYTCQPKPKEEESKNREKADILSKKKQRLIELYLAQDISREEFCSMKEKYEKDMEILSQTERNHSFPDLSGNQADFLENTGAIIDSLVIGELWEDTFYREILALAAVDAANTIRIKLKGLEKNWDAVLIS